MKSQRNSYRDHTAEQTLFVRRALLAFVGILLLSGILVVNLYHLQILRFEDYSTRSNQNRIKLVPVAPSRGIIYDRNGVALALNRTIYQAELVPEKVDNLKQTLQDLRPILDLTAFRSESVALPWRRGERLPAALLSLRSDADACRRLRLQD